MASLAKYESLISKITLLLPSSLISAQREQPALQTGMTIEYRAIEAFDVCLKESAANNEFLMFLYSEDFVAGDLHFLLHLSSPKVKIFTSPYRFGNKIFHRPLLIDAATLNQRWAHLSAFLISDPEATLVACVSQFAECEAMHVNDWVIRQTGSIGKGERPAYLESLSVPPPHLDVLRAPSLSIILVNYNMGNFIDTALSSFACQYIHADQVLLMDDGSTDMSRERMREWTHKVPNAEIFDTDVNLGKARAMNRLLPYITSEFALEVDADDWLDPSAVQQIRYRLQMLPVNTHLLYGNLRTWTKHGNGEYQCKGIHKGRPILTPQELISYPLPLGPRIYRTTVLRQIGGVPVSVFRDGRLYEDVLAIRSLMETGEIHYEDFTVYNYLRHRHSITLQNQAYWKQFVAREF